MIVMPPQQSTLFGMVFHIGATYIAASTSGAISSRNTTQSDIYCFYDPIGGSTTTHGFLKPNAWLRWRPVRGSSSETLYPYNLTRALSNMSLYYAGTRLWRWLP